MKKFIAAVTWFFIITEVLHAQLDTFDLSTYKLPVIERKALNLTTDLNGSNELSKTKHEHSGDNTDNYFILRNFSSLGYSSYKNNDRLQSNQYYYLGLSPSWNKRVINDTSVLRKSYMGTEFQISSNNRMYFQNQFFFEPDVYFRWSMNSRNEKDESAYSEYKTSWTDLSVGVPLLMGKGRIEQVQDARLAIYILDELQKAGRIARVPEDNEILELAALISQVTNERYFDYRIHKMAEIEKADSFLQARAIITQPDARYFTTLSDNWEYASGPVRENGKRISTGIVPFFGYYYNYSKSTNNESPSVVESKNQRLDYDIKALVTYTSAKPLNLKWQRDWSMNISYGYEKTFYKDLIDHDDRDSRSLNVAGDVHYGLGFYPNSRTSFTGELSLNALRSNREFNSETTNNKEHFTEIKPQFSLSVNYYISPQLRFYADYTLGYIYTNDDEKPDLYTEYSYIKTNSLQQSIEARFVYSIF